MANSIKVINEKNNTIWERQLTAEEFAYAKSTCKGKNSVGMTIALLIPVRTNNGSNFARDFFLPISINHVIKIERIALKIFAFIAALFLDLITLPIRLLTSIPRIIANAKKTTPLQKYLEAQGIEKEILKADYLKVELRCLLEGFWVPGHRSIKNECDLMKVNLIEVPGHYC